MGESGFYFRKDVLKALTECAKGKEVGVLYGKGAFGKRPDVILFEKEIVDFVQKGAVSFHLSEESWMDPLSLKPDLSEQDYRNLRIGWDLIIDIDGPFACSQIAAYLVVDALGFHDIKNLSVKFSGNKGFHIGVPAESFPEVVNGKKTKDLFPEGVRVIAGYLQDLIRDHLRKMLLEKFSLKELSELCGKSIGEMGSGREVDPFKIVSIDTVLISKRHLFRAPYSLHEKTGLVSLPIPSEQILSFEKKQAEPENIKLLLPFLDRKKSVSGEATSLIIQAFDWSSKSRKKEERREPGKKFESVGEALTNEELFPPCMRIGLQGLEDGKKRFLFALLNFLKHVGWTDEMIAEKVKEWNEKNPEKLRETYYLPQLSWHKKRQEKILPPNCSNAGYYKDMGICKPDSFCSKIRNPVNYSLLRLRALRENQKPKKSRSKK